MFYAHYISFWARLFVILSHFASELSPPSVVRQKVYCYILPTSSTAATRPCASRVFVETVFAYATAPISYISFRRGDCRWLISQIFRCLMISFFLYSDMRIAAFWLSIMPPMIGWAYYYFRAIWENILLLLHIILFRLSAICSADILLLARAIFEYWWLCFAFDDWDDFSISAQLRAFAAGSLGPRRRSRQSETPGGTWIFNRALYDISPGIISRKALLYHLPWFVAHDLLQDRLRYTAFEISLFSRDGDILFTRL